MNIYKAITIRGNDVEIRISQSGQPREIMIDVEMWNLPGDLADSETAHVTLDAKELRALGRELLRIAASANQECTDG